MEHHARVEWTLSGDFAAGRYSRAHQWVVDEGYRIDASASPHNVQGPWINKAAIDPEEALVGAVSACHMLWFLWLAQQAGHVVLSYRDAAVGKMGKDDRGKIAITSVTLRPEISFDGAAPDAAELDRLHHEAHQRCFIANSIRAEVRVEAAGAAFAARSGAVRP